MAVTFGSRTVTSPDNSVKTIDIGVGEHCFIPFSTSPQNASKPSGFNEVCLTFYASITGGPASGNITLSASEGMKIGLCAGTTYSPSSSSFFGAMAKFVQTPWTGVASAGTNNYFYVRGDACYSKGGTDTGSLGGASINWARDETSATYPIFWAIQFRHYTTNHWFVASWPSTGWDDWFPLATMKSIGCHGQWTPRDHINKYFNTEKGLGTRATNPSTLNIYPLDTDMANLDTIFFYNYMPSGIGLRIMYPRLFRWHNVAAGA